jgi:uncharacterized protein YjbI with pentapeptide repeats
MAGEGAPDGNSSTSCALLAASTICTMATEAATGDPAGESPPVLPAGRRNLIADCGSCFGLCCVALQFARSADFAIDKPAGTPCPNLSDDFRCGIHSRLRTTGFVGCTVYDCFGAGQQVSQVTFGGSDWRDSAETAAEMHTVFPIMRDLHELLWYLEEALTLDGAAELRSALAEALGDTRALAASEPAVLVQLDVDEQRRRVGSLLRRASALARVGSAPPRRVERAGSDLMGAKLAGADLRGADLRSAYLIGADLRGADLRRADVLGADLRAANVRGADLSTSLFLTQFQVNAAIGDTATRIPSRVTRPTHWLTGTTVGRRGLRTGPAEPPPRDASRGPR